MVDTASGQGARHRRFQDRRRRGRRPNPGANKNPTGRTSPLTAVYSRRPDRQGVRQRLLRGVSQDGLRRPRREGPALRPQRVHGDPGVPRLLGRRQRAELWHEDGLPSVIVAGLSAAMSGFSIWGHDVGGYLNAHFSPISPADLFMRWTQFGCFSPIMQMHRQVDSDEPPAVPLGLPRGRRDDGRTTGTGQLPVLRDAPHPAVPLPLHLRQAVERDRPADPPPARPDAPGRPGNLPPSRISTISATTCSSPR